MAEEEDLKMIELKVSANCCEGCRRKVLKALSIKGVLKAEIHPSLPRVTVVGSTDVVTLVKKLAKCSKSAEILRVEQAKTSSSSSLSKSKPSEVTENTNEQETKKSRSSEKKEAIHNSSDSSCKCEKEKKGSKGDSKVANDFKPSDGHNDDDLPKTIHPTVMTSSATPTPMAASYARVYYPTEPLPMVYNYAMNPYSVAAPPPPCCPQDHCCHCMRPPPQQMNPPQQGSSGFGDYFNDDNASGCHVM